MGILDWFGQNWFDLLQTVGIIGGLIFTAKALRDDSQERRVTNLLFLTKNHRELWSNAFYRPELARVFEASVDLTQMPVTSGEHLFVNLVIQHVHSAFQAMGEKLVIKPESVSRDIGSFFSLPIPNAIWRQAKRLQDEDFAAFVESCLKSR
jgi:hypothetical protein